MPNVESQLRQYFDSTVERIDAEDVLAGVRVTNQRQRWNARARRPLRAAVASAALVTVAISAVVAGAWMLGQTGSRIVGPGGAEDDPKSALSARNRWLRVPPPPLVHLRHHHERARA